MVTPSDLRRSMVYRPADKSWVDIPLQGLDYINPEQGAVAEQEEEKVQEEGMGEN